MITICNEEYQEKYNITNGCWCCGTKELTEDIKEVQFVPGSMSKTITLCKKCRNELLNVLKEHDDVEITESITVETKEDESVSVSNMETSDFKEENDSEVIETEKNIYAKEMNANIDVSKVIESYKSEPNDVPIEELVNKILESNENFEPIFEPEFDVETWVNSLIEENETEKDDIELSHIVSNAVEKVLNPSIPETIAGQKLHMLTATHINPVVYMCKNCEMEFDKDDLNLAQIEGKCAYCGTDLTQEYDPNHMRVGKSSLKML